MGREWPFDQCGLGLGLELGGGACGKRCVVRMVGARSGAQQGPPGGVCVTGRGQPLQVLVPDPVIAVCRPGNHGSKDPRRVPEDGGCDSSRAAE